jgi:hypothetical protein
MTDMANIKYFADTAAGTLVFDRVDYLSRKDIRGYDQSTASWGESHPRHRDQVEPLAS